MDWRTTPLQHPPLLWTSLLVRPCATAAAAPLPPSPTTHIPTLDTRKPMLAAARAGLLLRLLVEFDAP